MLVLLVIWLVRGSVRVRYRKLIFKVFLKFLHISCHVNCSLKMASFRCVWLKFDSESPLVWSFKAFNVNNDNLYELNTLFIYFQLDDYVSDEEEGGGRVPPLANTHRVIMPPMFRYIVHLIRIGV